MADQLPRPTLDGEPAAPTIPAAALMFSSDRRRLRGARAQRWFRWLHSYTSMISLLIVLFFGATGITLNHPTWTLGDHADHTAASGTLPVGFAPSGIVDFLAVSEYARATYGITAEVSDYGADPAQGHISYAGPGYAASIVFDVATGAYTVDVEQQGFVAVLNDLHKGRSTNGSWNWTIDLAGGLLVVVAVTGLGIQLFLRKRRGRLLGIAAAGAVLVCIVGYLTLA